MTIKDRFTISFVFLKLFCDSAVIYAVFLLSFHLRFYADIFAAPRGVPDLSDYQLFFAGGTILIVMLFRNKGLYRGFWRGRFADEVVEVCKAVFFGIFIMMAFSFMYREFTFSRGLVVIAMPLEIVAIALERLIIERIELALRRRKGLFTSVVIIGSGEPALRIARGILKNKVLGYELKGFIAARPIDISAAGIDRPWIGRIDALQRVLEKGETDEVILAENKFTQDEIMRIILTCEKSLVSFKFVPGIFEMMTSNVNILSIDGISVLDMHRFPLQSLWARLIKRGFDVVGSLAGLIVFSPLFAVVGFLIRIDSRGPVFFLQERCGEDGKVFNIIKFRTMVVGAEQETGPVWATADDARKTRLGTFLRKTNIDELPQMINVFKGDMSMVGPRPERPYFVERFKEDVPRYMSRHFVKSGMTGWAQVNGLRGDTSIEERIKYDLYYIENWSLFFDIKILFLTFFARKNAY
jgi:exopolysaccharide biosynthesis polyprenyl glycosylphosphotransferase